MNSNDLIERGKKSVREYVIQLLDEVDHLNKDVGELEKSLHILDKKVLVLQTKAAAYGTAAGLTVSIIAKYVL